MGNSFRDESDAFRHSWIINHGHVSSEVNIPHGAKAILNDPTNSQENIAMDIIGNAFKDKTDRAGMPYIHHLYRVSFQSSNKSLSLSKEFHCLKTIGLLHDLLEDCPEWTEGALRSLFSDEIVDVVVILTKLKDEKYEDYIERVLRSKYARIVKKADLEHNMDLTRLPEITDKDIERTKKYHKAYNRILAYEKELRDNQ